MNTVDGLDGGGRIKGEWLPWPWPAVALWSPDSHGFQSQLDSLTLWVQRCGEVSSVGEVNEMSSAGVRDAQLPFLGRTESFIEVGAFKKADAS